MNMKAENIEDDVVVPTESIDDIIKEMEQKETIITTENTEVIKKQEAANDKESYQESLEQGQYVMGFLLSRVNKKWPYVGFGENEKEVEDFYNEGSKHIANVLNKYGGLEKPAWYLKWKEEIDAIKFFGGVGASVYFQVQEHEENTNEDDKKGVDDGDK